MKKLYYIVIALTSVFLACQKEDGQDSAQEKQKGIAVTGECLKVECVSADVCIYVNTDSAMFQSEAEGSNIAGVQVCTDKIWGNAVEILPVPHKTANGYYSLFDDHVQNMARIHLKDLLPNTTYYYRAFVKIANARRYGSTMQFSTREMSVPSSGFVNLGLSVKWSACNVGATSPETVGDILDDESRNSFNLPTTTEWQELIDKCAWSVTTYNAQRGLIVTGPSGLSIFLPSSKPVVNSKDDEQGIVPITAGGSDYGCYACKDDACAFSFDGGYYDDCQIAELSPVFLYKLSVRTVQR